MTDAEIRELILEHARLKKTKIPNCRGCQILKRHPCGAFYYCKHLGAVDPDLDGCSKKV